MHWFTATKLQDVFLKNVLQGIGSEYDHPYLYLNIKSYICFVSVLLNIKYI